MNIIICNVENERMDWRYRLFYLSSNKSSHSKPQDTQTHTLHNRTCRGGIYSLDAQVDVSPPNNRELNTIPI